jgi:maltooligosyltrehalose trehalohydrolase
MRPLSRGSAITCCRSARQVEADYPRIGALLRLYSAEAARKESADAVNSECKEPLGATLLEDNTCSFLVWAPRARQVEVCLSDTPERRIVMQAKSCGYFHAVVGGISPGALYRYRLEDEKERPDPASRHQPQGVHGPSQVVDNRFHWNDSSWKGLPLEKYVLYELHVGTFTPPGTFDAIIPRIALLKQLGITAIELMPIAQFPGNRNWGYDGVYPYAVQASYGGPDALKKLVNACHQHGIALVLDVVYNHLGPEGNYLTDFGPYFTDQYKTPWGQAINFDDAGSDEVRRYFIENALQWVTDFHIDALRLDAVHAIVDLTARTFLEQLAEAVHEAGRKLRRSVYLIQESNRNDPRAVSPPELGGSGYDAVWNDDFHHSLHVLLTGEQAGYYMDFHGIEDLAGCYREGFLYSGQYSKYRQRRHGSSSKQIPAKRFVVCAQSHDQVGNRNRCDRLTKIVSFEQLKLAAAAVLLSPYIPLLFMGEEYGETAPFLYFVSHGDPELVEAVRRGRREEFARFSWNQDMADPQSEETFFHSKLNWALQAEGQHRILWLLYQELLRLRREIPSLARLDKDTLEVTSFRDEKILLINRWDASSRVFVAAHFSEEPKELTLPISPGTWQKRLDSADQRWAGKGSLAPANFESPGEMQLTFGPWNFLLFDQTVKISE